jgi:hypothetical protein
LIGLLGRVLAAGDTYRVAELSVEAIAQLVDAGGDLVEVHRLFSAISFYHIHLVAERLAGCCSGTAVQVHNSYESKQGKSSMSSMHKHMQTTIMWGRRLCRSIMWLARAIPFKTACNTCLNTER